jgi:hypothetical protein
VLPILRKQERFKDEFFFVSPDRRILYTQGYPQILQAFTDLLTEKTQVKMYELTNSTFHKIAAHAAV